MATEEEIQAYARALVGLRIGEAGRSARSVAGELGVSDGFVSQFRAAKVGMGFGPLLRLAQLYGSDLAALERQADSFKRSGMLEAPRAVESHVERPERYPDRPDALAFFLRKHRGEPLAVQAAEKVRGLMLKSEHDPGAQWWLEEAETELRLLSRQQRDPVGTQRAAEALDREAQERVERLKREDEQTERDLDARRKAHFEKKKKEREAEAKKRGK